jgi:hypothetical protein
MVAEAKLALDLLGKLLGWFKEKLDGRRVSQEIETLVSEGYRELLSGGSANLYKVRSIVARLDQLGDTSSAGYRLRDGYARSAKKSAPKKSTSSRKYGGSRAAKKSAKPAAKKTAAKKTTAKKAAPKKATAKKSTAAKKTATKKTAAKKTAS